MLDISVGQTFKATLMAMIDLDRLVVARVPSMDRRNTSSTPLNSDRSKFIILDGGVITQCRGAFIFEVGNAISNELVRCLGLVAMKAALPLPSTDAIMAAATTNLFNLAMIGN
jgi:hypothetical protein